MNGAIERLSRDEFDSIYTRVPRLTAEVIIVSSLGVVLSRRDIEPARGLWHIPGGTVLLGESIKDTAKRVALEETGLEVIPGEILGVLEYPDLDERGKQSVGVAIWCIPIGGKLTGSEQGQDVRWFIDIPSETIGTQKRFLEGLQI